MNNIPTGLLRTFITVVDRRSFTEAARVLGVTQPAVSAHIKRLQAMLGHQLLHRSRRGLKLTPTGEAVVSHARHLLSINDLIVNVTEPGAGGQTIHLGVPPEFLGVTLPNLLVELRERWPDLRFAIHTGGLDPHLGELREGRLDLVVGLSLTEPAMQVRHHWTERAVWLRGPTTRLDPEAPVPLVALSENCIYYRAALSALKREGRESELVLVGPTIIGLTAAVGAGLGVMALPRSRVSSPNVRIWDDAPLPKLPDFIWGIYLRDGGEREPLTDLADSIAAELRARTVAAARPQSTRSPKPAVAFTWSAAVS